MNRGDVVGFLACGLVLATFCMRRMAPLRLTAIASNLAFTAYATGHGLVPILLLHLTLLPRNLRRLLDLSRPPPGAGAPAIPGLWRPGLLVRRAALGLGLSLLAFAHAGAGRAPPADFWFEPVWLAGSDEPRALLNRPAGWSEGDAAVVLLWPRLGEVPDMRDGLTRALVDGGAAVLELDYRPDETAQLPALLAQALQMLREDLGAGLLLAIGQGEAGRIARARAEADRRGPTQAAAASVVAAAALMPEGWHFVPGARPAATEAWPRRAVLLCAALPPEMAAGESCRAGLGLP